MLCTFKYLHLWASKDEKEYDWCNQNQVLIFLRLRVLAGRLIIYMSQCIGPSSDKTQSACSKQKLPLLTAGEKKKHPSLNHHVLFTKGFTYKLLIVGMGVRT